jgi:hypothetical protein
VRNCHAGAGARPELVALAAHCRQQAEVLERRGQEGAACKWRCWAAALKNE